MNSQKFNMTVSDVIGILLAFQKNTWNIFFFEGQSYKVELYLWRLVDKYCQELFETNELIPSLIVAIIEIGSLFDCSNVFFCLVRYILRVFLMISKYNKVMLSNNGRIFYYQYPENSLSNDEKYWCQK